MSDKGILKPDERTELLDGHVISMAAKKPPHSIVNQLAGDYLKQVLSGQAVVRTQEAVHLNAKSEPEPDIAVVQLPLTRYSDHHPYPEEVLLLIEVADTTLNGSLVVLVISFTNLRSKLTSVTESYQSW